MTNLDKIVIRMSKTAIYAFIISQSMMLAFAGGLNAQRKSLNEIDITLSKQNSDWVLRELLSEIESRSDFSFALSKGDVSGRKIYLKSDSWDMNSLLIEVSSQGRYAIKRVNETIALKPVGRKNSLPEVVEMIDVYTQSIEGKVLDENGEPLPGATIMEKGTTNGTITDVEGNFSLEVGDDAVLLVSFIGYLEQEIIVSGRTSVNVSLEVDVQSLSEVIVIGYGVMNKSDQTGAIGSVKGEKVIDPSSAVVSEGLIGKMAGVDISSSTYSGEQPNISIRGVRSLNASNNPLVIIDGVPGSLSTISPYDIKSIEVLKDASSAAVFGTRAANGVILVTTKRAPDSEYSISYNTSIGVNKLNLVDMMSGEAYAQFRRDGVRMNNGWESGNPTDASVFFQEELDAISDKSYHDWQKMFFRDGLIQQHNISLGYKEDKTSFIVSGTLMDDRGYIPTNAFSKQNMNFSLDHELKDWLDFGATVRFTRNKLEGLATPSNAEIYYMNPFSNPRDENGDLIDFPSAVESAGYNILANTRADVYEDFKIDKTMEYLFYFNIQPFEGFTIKPMIGVRDQSTEQNHFYGSKSFERKNKVPEASKYHNDLKNYTFDFINNYHREFGDHSFDFDAIFETVHWQTESFEAFGRNQPVEATKYHSLESSSEDVSIASDFTKWTLASLVGRVRYNYKNKYLLKASFRRDGSSRLADGNKWSNFPGLSAAWRINEEAFFDSNLITELKLRGSYGEVGNTSVDPYSTLPVLAARQYSFDEVGSYYYNPSSALSNPNLGWEISRTIDFGVDLGLMEDRITLSLDVYRTTTDDVILNRTLPIFSGYSSTTQNVAQTQNQGIEIAVGFVPIQTQDAMLTIDLNYANNQQEILKLTGETDRIINSTTNSLLVGQPLNIFYDYEFGGIWQTSEAAEAATFGEEPGMIKIVDQDGNGVIDPEDRKVLGQASPKHIFGFSSTFRYKKFDLLVNANARLGHMISSETFGSDLSFSGSRWLPNINYWTPENPSNEYPAANAGTNLYNNQQVLDYISGDFIRLRQIALGYDFGEIVSKLVPIKRLRAYVQINNPFYIYKAAPEDIHPEAPDLQRTIPTTYLFGMNINL